MELNNLIRTVHSDSPLYKLPPVVDPSNETAEVLVKSLEWNMLSREWNLNVGDLSDLHLQSKDLLPSGIARSDRRILKAISEGRSERKKNEIEN